MIIRFIKKSFYILLSYAVIVALSACGSDSNSTATAGRNGPTPGTLTINITDAPVDNVQEVWVQFTGLSIKPAGGKVIDFTFDTVKNINLLALQGELSTFLIDKAVIPSGGYNWIRLNVNAENDGNTDTYIKLNDGSVHELWIPSNRQSGLKIITRFEVSANGNLDLMLDFDLRKSIVLNKGNYKLRPTLRMVKTRDTGNIRGTIDSALLTATNCSDIDPATGNAVYLFTGTDITPNDVNSVSPGPLTSASIKLNETNGNYRYIIGYVPEGEYTLAFTCQADLDDPDVNDDIAFGFTSSVTVTARRNNVPITVPEAMPVR